MYLVCLNFFVQLVENEKKDENENEFSSALFCLTSSGYHTNEIQQVLKRDMTMEREPDNESKAVTIIQSRSNPTGERERERLIRKSD